MMAWITFPHLHNYTRLSVWSTGKVYEVCRCGRKRSVNVGQTTVKNIKISIDDVGAIVGELVEQDNE